MWRTTYFQVCIASWFARGLSGVDCLAHYVVGVPVPALAGSAFKPMMMFFGSVVSEANHPRVREDRGRLPALLDHVDAPLRQRTIGGDAPNAADLQILTSIRLLITHEDLRPIAPRPCGEAALRLIPDYPRSGPDALPLLSPRPSPPSGFLRPAHPDARRLVFAERS